MGSSKQKHVRLHGQSPGDGHPLLLAAGELVGIVARPVGQAHLLQQGQPPAGMASASPIRQALGKTPGQGHIFQGGVLWKQVEIWNTRPKCRRFSAACSSPAGAGPVQQDSVP